MDRNVAAATQNQALNALVFLNGKVLNRPLGNIGSTVWAKRPPLLPVVLSHEEAITAIERLAPPYRLMALLVYGADLRVVETVRLRVMDLNFSRHVITVRNGKGGKERTTLMPEMLRAALHDRVEEI